ncbi:MAG: DUF1513 domain-containing protein [Planctomycetes bacterium]|nr:DUF1513 domain-containing protein [Planctomycetota bacterium]
MDQQPDNHRRRFIQAGAVAGAGLLVTACGGGNNATGNGPYLNEPGNQPADNADTTPPAPGKLGTVVGGGVMADEQGAKAFFTGVIDLDAEKPAARPIEGIGFLGHGFTPRLDKPHVVMITEKHGQGCLELDLTGGKVLRKVTPGAGREFYGHSAFSPDGKLWYCTEADTEDGSYNGVLAIRDAQSMELRDQTFPTHGVSPHDCILIDDGATLVITNGGGPVGHADEPACVAYVNVKTGEARKLLKFKNDKINAGHIAMTSRGELVCVSAPRDGIDSASDDWRGAITFYHPDKDSFVTADDPIRSQMKGETLSVAINEKTMIVAATNPAGNIVTFWDFKTGKLVKSLTDFKSPRGISLSLDGRWFILTHDQATNLTRIDADTLEPEARPAVETSYISGSHNFVFDL